MTITGTGSLQVVGGYNGAGIGGGNEHSGGTVTINGGTVTATGGQDAAGIGGGNSGASGTVTINGGMVTATAGVEGAGIGSGYNKVYNDSNTVTITGGTVVANGKRGGAGIGGGLYDSSVTVKISGGNVRAAGSEIITNDGSSEDIGAGAKSSGNSTLTDDNGIAVYRIALTLEGYTPIGGLTAANISSTYGMEGVKPLDGNNLYFYLPKDTVVNSVTTGDTPPRLFTNQGNTPITVANNHNNTGTLTEATATISDVTVSGIKDKQITTTNVTVTLAGIAFNTLNAGFDVSGWFTNRPEGITAVVATTNPSGATTATFTLTGTPTETSSEAIQLTIPRHFLSVIDADLTAKPNANAKWSIVTPTVASVTVSPATANVVKGGSKQFSATVTGTNSPTQTVTWSVTGGVTGTSIDASGRLTVAANETATTLTVTATSTVDNTKSGTATVTVNAPASTVTSVAVSPATANVVKGGSKQFSATVTGTNSPAQTVTWSVTGGVTGTSIDASGNLTVAANETAKTLTIKAISTVDTTKSGTATVTVTAPAPTGYEITQGQHGQWIKGSGVGLGFTANGDYSKFTDVSVDGAALSDDDYTSKSGSTIVTLNAAYLETLTAGWHTLRINFTDGYAETNFFIAVTGGTGGDVGADVPKTGDTAVPMLWLALMLLAGAGLTVSVVCRRKRQNG